MVTRPPRTITLRLEHTWTLSESDLNFDHDTTVDTPDELRSTIIALLDDSIDNLIDVADITVDDISVSIDTPSGLSAAEEGTVPSTSGPRT